MVPHKQVQGLPRCKVYIITVLNYICFFLAFWHTILLCSSNAKCSSHHPPYNPPHHHHTTHTPPSPSLRSISVTSLCICVSLNEKLLMVSQISIQPLTGKKTKKEQISFSFSSSDDPRNKKRILGRQKKDMMANKWKPQGFFFFLSFH